MEEEREVRLDEEERKKGSAVICTQTGYAFMDERRKRSDKLTRGDDKWACLGEVVLEVSMTASNKDKWTIRKVGELSKQRANKDPIENLSPKSPMAPKVTRKKALPLETGNYEVLRHSQHDHTIPAHQEKETSELTFWLLPQAITVSIPNYKRVTSMNPAAPNKIGMAHISAFSGLNDHVGCTEFRYARAFQLFWEWYLGKKFPPSSMVDQRSLCRVKRSLESSASGGNMPTGRWLLPMVIGLIRQRLQSHCPSTSMVSPFPSVSIQQNPHPNRLLYATAGNNMLENVKEKWIMAGARSPSPPSMVQSRWTLLPPVQHTRGMDLLAAQETFTPISNKGN